MKARCTYCGWHWGVSIKQEIPKSGYECPLCAGKRKRAQKEQQLQSGPKKNYLSA